MELISFVIPSYNPGLTLLDAVLSVRSQTHTAIEIIVVDDGTDTEEGREALQSVSCHVDRCIRQPNRGLPAARNAGFRAANGAYVAPLDSDDILDRRYAAECLAALATSSAAAFAYTDCRVFGERNYVERYDAYNFYSLLDNNTLPYAALIRKEAWAAAEGYDERMRLGFEDWEFWLRLGAEGRYGTHVSETLFHYRKHGPSLFDVARKHEGEIRRYIREKHPALYEYESRAHIKAVWQPAACMVGPIQPSILDCETTDIVNPQEILRNSRARAFVISSGSGQPCSAELAALAVWGGHRCSQLPDGSLAVSRECLARCRNLAELSPDNPLANDREAPAGRRLSDTVRLIHRHLFNAGLLSARTWLRHPLRSALRLIPVRVKEEINRRTDHAIFDLSFYLQFQPASVILGRTMTTPLSYFPRLSPQRRRVALVTPHLGPGGAERVLFDIACSLDTSRFEIFLIATQSSDARWRSQWERTADSVFDLAALVPPERVPGALYSVVRNWRFETLLISNALPAYSVIRELKADLPAIRIIDLVHAVDEEWDLVSATKAVAGFIDTRIVISEAVRAQMRRANTPDASIRLIRNGVDLARFVAASHTAGSRRRILFAGRLDPVKRPLLLVDIAVSLKKRRGKADFRIVVAGDGPEGAILRERARGAGIAESFEFLGHVPEITPLFAEADLLVLTSRSEGIPMVVLEAFAAGKPVVASDAGAVNEVVDAETGFLIRISPGEADLFAEAIDTLLDSPELRGAMGRKARCKVEAGYSLEEFRRAYRDLFDAAPRRHSPAEQ